MLSAGQAVLAAGRSAQIQAKRQVSLVTSDGIVLEDVSDRHNHNRTPGFGGGMGSPGTAAPAHPVPELNLSRSLPDQDISPILTPRQIPGRQPTPEGCDWRLPIQAPSTSTPMCLCGKPLVDGSTFCSRCGSRLEEVYTDDHGMQHLEKLRKELSKHVQHEEEAAPSAALSSADKSSTQKQGSLAYTEQRRTVRKPVDRASPSSQLRQTSSPQLVAPPAPAQAERRRMADREKPSQGAAAASTGKARSPRSSATTARSKQPARSAAAKDTGAVSTALVAVSGANQLSKRRSAADEELDAAAPAGVQKGKKREKTLRKASDADLSKTQQSKALREKDQEISDLTAICRAQATEFHQFRSQSVEETGVLKDRILGFEQLLERFGLTDPLDNAPSVTQRVSRPMTPRASRPQASSLALVEQMTPSMFSPAVSTNQGSPPRPSAASPPRVRSTWSPTNPNIASPRHSLAESERDRLAMSAHSRGTSPEGRHLPHSSTRHIALSGGGGLPPPVAGMALAQALMKRTGSPDGRRAASGDWRSRMGSSSSCSTLFRSPSQTGMLASSSSATVLVPAMSSTAAMGGVLSPRNPLMVSGNEALLAQRCHGIAVTSPPLPAEQPLAAGRPCLFPSPPDARAGLLAHGAYGNLLAAGPLAPSRPFFTAAAAASTSGNGSPLRGSVGQHGRGRLHIERARS